MSENGILRRRARVKTDDWSIDFIFDRTANGQILKRLSVIDEFRRECLAFEVKQSMAANDMMQTLSELVVLIRGMPRHVRCDNRSQFIPQTIGQWLALSGVRTLYIEPASPWQNGFVESIHSRLRDELLKMEVFKSLKEAKQLATHWRLD